MNRFVSIIALCLSCSLIVLGDAQVSRGDCGPAPKDDPCTDYTCDPDRGWVPSPKCDDGLYCTVDRCSIQGECRFVPVDCSAEILLPPCFTARCAEGVDRYKCYMKPITCDNHTQICVDNTCIEKDSLSINHWAVEFTFNESFTLSGADVDTMMEIIHEGFSVGWNSNATVEMNENNQCTGVILLVENEEMAHEVSDEVNRRLAEGDCRTGILCKCNGTRILEKKKDSSATTSSDSTSRAIISSSTGSVASSSTKPSVGSVDVGEHNAKTCIISLFVALLITIEILI